jgi:hypothetical protein
MREAAKIKGESTFCNASIDGLEYSKWFKGGGAGDAGGSSAANGRLAAPPRTAG